MSDKTTTPERKYDTHEKRRELAALRYKGDRNAINDRVHVTLTKMNLRNGYSDALEKHAAPQEVRIQELEDQVKALRDAGQSLREHLNYAKCPTCSGSGIMQTGRPNTPESGGGALRMTVEQCITCDKRRDMFAAWGAASKPSNNNTGS